MTADDFSEELFVELRAAGLLERLIDLRVLWIDDRGGFHAFGRGQLGELVIGRGVIRDEHLGKGLDVFTAGFLGTETGGLHDSHAGCGFILDEFNISGVQRVFFSGEAVRGEKQGGAKCEGRGGDEGDGCLFHGWLWVR